MDSKKPRRTGFGLAHWLQQAVEERDKVGQDFAVDPVHDLRVALRRCRSMADGVMTVDWHPAWKRMKKAGKELFSSLGDLRDTQVMAEWVLRLGSPEDPVTKALFNFASTQERALRDDATQAVTAFDRKEWERWSDLLPPRAQRIASNSVIFKHLALERWTEARALHQRAMRNRSKVTLHQLRIGLKKFRYIVENFLPALHEKWSADLKDLQDVLGEIHDLDVIWATALQIKAFADASARTRWQERIQAERSRRLEKYRSRMLGKNSLWEVWRAELPVGAQIEAAAMERLKMWASLLDPDFRHSRHVAGLAQQLYDKLPTEGFIRPSDRKRLRLILQAAALMHDVGRSKRRKKHQKISFQLIRKLAPPLGWRAPDLQMAAVVARHHRGSLPQPTQKHMLELSEAQGRTVVFLAGILRLADALDRESDGRVKRVQVEEAGSFLTVWAHGQALEGRQLEAVAGARYLLEAAYERPVLVRSRTLGLHQSIYEPDPKPGRTRQSRPAA